MRCTQSEEQLSALALIDMNYEYDIILIMYVSFFFSKISLKMEKASLLFS